MDIELQHLFADPLYQSKTLYEFSEAELKFIQNLDKIYNNNGNQISANNHILQCEEMESVRKFIERGISQYVEFVLSPKNKELEFYISHSWAIYLDLEMMDEIKVHRNSLFSGYLQMKVDEEYDNIMFNKNKYQRISIPSQRYNRYNSDYWCLHSRNGQLIMFDSLLYHEMKIANSNETRIYIAFDVFVKGNISNDFSQLSF